MEYKMSHSPATLATMRRVWGDGVSARAGGIAVKSSAATKAVILSAAKNLPLIYEQGDPSLALRMTLVENHSRVFAFIRGSKFIMLQSSSDTHVSAVPFRGG